MTTIDGRSSWSPALMAHAGAPMVAWTDSATSYLTFASGASDPPYQPQPIEGWSSNDAPALGATDKFSWLAWRDDSNSDNEIQLGSSENGWGGYTTIAMWADSGPGMAWDGSSLFVCWLSGDEYALVAVDPTDMSWRVIGTEVSGRGRGALTLGFALEYELVLASGGSATEVGEIGIAMARDASNPSFESLDIARVRALGPPGVLFGDGSWFLTWCDPDTGALLYTYTTDLMHIGSPREVPGARCRGGGPAIAPVEDRLVVAWTQIGDGQNGDAPTIATLTFDDDEAREAVARACAGGRP